MQAVCKPCLLFCSPAKLQFPLQGLLGQTQQMTGVQPGSLRHPLQGHQAQAALMTGQAGASPKGAETSLRMQAKVIPLQGSLIAGGQPHSEGSRLLC